MHNCSGSEAERQQSRLRDTAIKTGDVDNLVKLYYPSLHSRDTECVGYSVVTHKPPVCNHRRHVSSSHWHTTDARSTRHSRTAANDGEGDDEFMATSSAETVRVRVIW